MRHRIRFCALLLVPLFTAAACAPPFTRDLRADPERYRGARLLLGGTVISVRNAPEGGVIEILHQPLDRRARPRHADRSEGRFLAQTGEFLDPAVYHAGREISIIGTVSGTATLRLDEVEYRYPLLKVAALHLWQPASPPRFFFSIGVGHYR